MAKMRGCCGGAVALIVWFFKQLHKSGFNLEFETLLESIRQAAADLWQKRREKWLLQKTALILFSSNVQISPPLQSLNQGSITLGHLPVKVVLIELSIKLVDISSYSYQGRKFYLFNREYFPYEDSYPPIFLYLLGNILLIPGSSNEACKL